MTTIFQPRWHSTDFSSLRTQCSFQFKTQNSAPLLSGGQPRIPFSTAHWPTYSACPNPRCYYCVKQTHHSLSTEVRNYPPLSGHREKRGHDATQERQLIRLVMPCWCNELNRAARCSSFQHSASHGPLWTTQTGPLKAESSTLVADGAQK